MLELSDEKIMLLVKDGHLSELTELFDRYHVPLYNFFLRLTVDKVISEDLTQNLFYRVIRYRQSYQPAQGT
ncbi:MAG TPA: sigma factor, partial [Puia sp.]|nr:sigma factor [Puia sp.]